MRFNPITGQFELGGGGSGGLANGFQTHVSGIAALKSLPTAGIYEDGSILPFSIDGEELHLIRFTAGSNNDDNAGDYRPDDYNAGTNNFYWHLAL